MAERLIVVEERYVYVYVKVLVQTERERWRLVGQERSCNVEEIGFEIGEESCMTIGEVIDVVSCKEGCRESNARIGWRIGNLGEVEVGGSFVEEIVVEVVLLEVQVEPVVVDQVDIVAVVEAEELGQVEGEH